MSFEHVSWALHCGGAACRSPTRMNASLCQRMCLLRRPLQRRRRSRMARTLPSHTLSRCSAPPPNSMMQVGHAHIARDLALQAALTC